MKYKKISLILLLSVFVVITGVVYLKKYENETLVEAKWNEKEDALLAITIDGEEAESFPTTRFFAATVECTNGNGKAVWNGTKWVFNVNSITTSKSFCNINFTTMENTVYQQLLSDYTNNKGVQKTTDENDKEIYYYTGNITNNNVVLNNFCWKMVRTTETDGIKMIYNGVYNETTKCNNTGTSTSINSNKIKYNTAYGAQAYIGYMYGTPYNYSTITNSSFGNFYYGTNVSWNGSQYSLVNASLGNISTMYSKLSTHHYTCLSTSRNCTHVHYIILMGSATDSASYITLSNGKKVDNAIDEMLNYNTRNSNIKTTIDNWYKNNMTNVSSYLENAMFCNNRNINNKGSWNPSGGEVKHVSATVIYNSTQLICPDKEDQFTLKVSAGGIDGYGNNSLDYPVGLLSYKEASLAIGTSATNYLNNSDTYWLMAPTGYSNAAMVYYVNNGKITNNLVTESYGTRPVVSLRNEIKITGGTGEKSDPYTITLPTG